MLPPSSGRQVIQTLIVATALLMAMPTGHAVADEI
jgi:hypothetical protein